MTYIVGEFDVILNELHNDSTTVTFSAEYPTASGPQRARNVPAITWGHNEDHRPPRHTQGGHTSVTRIVGLLAVYFLALMVQSLVERELCRSMAETGLTSVPLYLEGRSCSRPTTRQVLDVVQPIPRHTICGAEADDIEIFSTEMTPLHRLLLKLLKTPMTEARVHFVDHGCV